MCAVPLPCSIPHCHIWQSYFTTRLYVLLLCIWWLYLHNIPQSSPPYFRLGNGAALCGCMWLFLFLSPSCWGCPSLVRPPGAHRPLPTPVFCRAITLHLGPFSLPLVCLTSHCCGSIFSLRSFSTPHSSDYNLKQVVEDVEHDCSILVEWFRDNTLTLNADKCHLLVSGFKYEAMYASVGDALLWEENSVKLLGLFIDSELSFNNHVKIICKKASQKLTATLRLANILSVEKRKILLKTFFESQFSYCPLLWMFCSRKLNHKINRLLETFANRVFRLCL